MCESEADTDSSRTGAVKDVRLESGETLSLIVPCYSLDRAADLQQLLDSVERQTSPVDELLVVVQQSESLLSLVDERLSRLRCASARALYVDGAPRVAHARNVGVRQAQGDIIAFVDDDAVLAETWSRMTRAFYADYPDAIGLAGAILPLWDTLSMAWFPRELYWMISCTYWRSNEPAVVRNGYGANMSFRRAAFDNGRLFDESLGISGWGRGGWHGVGGEEPEFSRRVARETDRAIYYVPDVIGWHRVRRYRLSTSNLVQRAYWEGRFKAAFRRSGTRSEDVLVTEKQLLHTIAHEGVVRLSSLLTEPRKMLRQSGVSALVLSCVGAGYIEGTVRRNRISV